jgi:hypothetical protein
MGVADNLAYDDTAKITAIKSVYSTVPCGLYYKHSTIVNDERLTLQIVALHL